MQALCTTLTGRKTAMRHPASDPNDRIQGLVQSGHSLDDATPWAPPATYVEQNPPALAGAEQPVAVPEPVSNAVQMTQTFAWGMLAPWGPVSAAFLQLIDMLIETQGPRTGRLLQQAVTALTGQFCRTLRWQRGHIDKAGVSHARTSRPSKPRHSQ